MFNTCLCAASATRTDRRRSDRGFTLIEMMIVVCVGMILAAMAVPVSTSFIKSSSADSAAVAAAAALETAKSRAVSERRNIRVTFVGSNTIRVERIEIPSGTATLIQEVPLEGGQQFFKFAITDTPDRFGGGAAISFTGTAPYMFTSDGSLIDSNGDVANGTVFLGIPNQVDTARAITVFGVTGLMRTWKWRGNAWVE